MCVFECVGPHRWWSSKLAKAGCHPKAETQGTWLPHMDSHRGRRWWMLRYAKLQSFMCLARFFLVGCSSFPFIVFFFLGCFIAKPPAGFVAVEILLRPTLKNPGDDFTEVASQPHSPCLQHPEVSQDTSSWTQTLGCLAWGALAKQLEALLGISKNSNHYMLCESHGPCCFLNSFAFRIWSLIIWYSFRYYSFRAIFANYL